MEAASILSAMKGEKLKDSPQWLTWFAKVQLYAVQKNVRDLCNPDLTSSTTDPANKRPEPLQEPAEPEYPKEGDERDRRIWRDRMDVYKVKYTRWEKEAKGLSDVNEYILTYLDPIHHLSLVAYRTPYDKLVYLKSRFARSTAYEEEIRMKWKVFVMQKPTGDIEEWLQQWNSLREQAVSLGINDGDANRDFLHAVKEVLPIWWQGKYQEIVMDKKVYDTRDLLESFRAMNREIGVQTVASTNAPKGAFSTWQGHQEAKPEVKQEKLPFEKRRCPCGSTHPRHKVATCYIMNEAIRPEGYTLNERTLEKAKKKLAKDLAWKQWVDKAVAEAQPKAEYANQVSFATTYQRHEAVQISKHVLSVAKSDEPSLHDRWILDTGSSTHICNDRSLFVDFTPDDMEVSTGDSTTKMLGKGTVRLVGRHPVKGRMEITLSDALYSPGFHTNLVSYAMLRKKGGIWCQKTNCIRDPNDRPVVSVHFWDHFNLWLFDKPGEAPPQQAYATQTGVRNSVKPQESKASSELWHRRLAHVEPRTIAKLASMVDGVVLEDKKSTEPKSLCQICKTGSAPRQISRRPVGRTFGRFGRVHFDLIQLPPAYNRHRWISHFYLEGPRFHWIMTHEVKPECQLAIKEFVQLARNQWKLPIKAFHYDNEAAAGRAAEYSLTADGILVYHTPPRHSEMNGYAEGSGGMIITRMRMLALEGKLPKDLWPEFASAAVWLLNRTPSYIATENRWVVPWEEVRKELAPVIPKTNLSNVRLYGSMAYCRIENQVQSDKMHPRAEIGFLVGYRASNIWKIWFPHSGKVKHIRDAVIDETRKYTPEYDQYKPIPLPLVRQPQELTTEEITKVINYEITGQQTSTMEESQGIQDRDDPQQHDPQHVNPQQAQENPQQVQDTSQEVIQETTGKASARRETTPSQGVREEAYWPTPSHPPTRTAPPGAFPEDQDLPPLPITPPQEEEANTGSGQGVDIQADQEDLAHEDQTQIEPTPDPIEDELERQLQSELLAPSREIVSDIDTGNILSGRRTRRARRDNDFAYATTTTVRDEEPPALLHAFAAGLYAEKPDSRRHRDDLPPPPKHWKDVINHPFQEGFLAAMRKEINSLSEKETFEIIDRPRDRGKQILPLLWVFSYKFDQDGYLLKLKASICNEETLKPFLTKRKGLLH